VTAVDLAADLFEIKRPFCGRLAVPTRVMDGLAEVIAEHTGWLEVLKVVEGLWFWGPPDPGDFSA
jgi:hypothetical protein